MKKVLLIIIVLLSTINILFAQSNITVRAIAELSNDTEGSVARRLDNRDKKCALIKVRTPNLNADERSKFTFQGDAGTEVFLEKANGELKLFFNRRCKETTNNA